MGGERKGGGSRVTRWGNHIRVLMRYTTNKEQHAYMKMRKEQNYKRCFNLDSENWFNDKLKKRVGFNFSRQAQWGYRIFDFWFPILGIAIEIDGKEHDKGYDSFRDKYNFERSGIIVLRIPNYNEGIADVIIKQINSTVETWLERRKRMGLLTKIQKKHV